MLVVGVILFFLSWDSNDINVFTVPDSEMPASPDLNQDNNVAVEMYQMAVLTTFFRVASLD
jgi:hypothetical protein